MENIQEQEVLIARNNETGQVGAVVGQNPDGTPKMADAKTAKLSDLVKFNKTRTPSRRSSPISSVRRRIHRCSASSNSLPTAMTLSLRQWQT